MIKLLIILKIVCLSLFVLGVIAGLIKAAVFYIDCRPGRIICRKTEEEARTRRS